MKFQRINDRKYKVGRDARGSNQYVRLVRVRRPRVRSYTAALTIGIIGAYLLTTLWLIPFYNEVKWKPAYAPTMDKAYALVIPTPTPSEDQRVNKVYKYLADKNSPLAYYADVIVKEADKNDISWTLVVAIAGKESSFGKVIKPNSHNAWGVMQWDSKGNRSIRSFNTWEEGIRFESALLGSFYREKMNKGIQESYCPSFECSDTWTQDVTTFQEEVNK